MPCSQRLDLERQTNRQELCVYGAQLRTLLKTRYTIECCDVGEVSGVLHWSALIPSNAGLISVVFLVW